MVTTLLATLLAYSLGWNVYSFADRGCVDKKSMIVRIGECDAEGICRVELNNGLYKTKRLPILGDYKTYKECSEVR